MKVKAVCAFVGVVSMIPGEIRDLDDGEILSDLLSAGYVVPLKETAEKPKEKANPSKAGRKKS